MTPQRDLSVITTTYFYDFEDPEIINAGWCWVWAWLAHLAHPNAQLRTVDTSQCAHAFVKIGSLYYDSLNPLGVRTVRSMRFFVEEGFVVTPGDVLRQTPEEFMEHWKYAAKSKGFESQLLPVWPRTLPPRPDLPMELV